MNDCDHQSNYVVDSRYSEFGIRRRRECAECGHRWSTMEITFEAARGKDPWAEYRKLAVKKFLGQALENLR